MAYDQNEPAQSLQDKKLEDREDKPRKLTYKEESAMHFRNYIQEYARGYVQLTSEVSYRITDVIQDNILDRNMTFSVPYYSDGEPKIFFSLPYIIADAIYKNTDIDTKDIQIRSDNDAAIEWVPLLRGSVAHYLKTSYYGERINEFRKELIDMGHLIVKEVDNASCIVQLLNVVRPPHITNLQDSGLAERSTLTWIDVLTNKEEWEKNKVWGKVLQHKEMLDASEKRTFVVYEWWTYDWFPKPGGEDGELIKTKGCIKYLDCSMFNEQVMDVPEDWEPYVELERFASPYEMKPATKARLNSLIASGYLPEGATTEPIYPYEEQYLIQVPGRWMGMGMYELLRPETIAYNKTLNEKMRYDEMLHKGILVHTKAPFSINQKGSGRSIESDIINRIQTGTMISVKAGEKIDRLNIGSLTADFLQTADKWYEIARKKAGVSDGVTGEPLPSSTPATIGVINERQTKTAFDIVNEQQGLFLERLFTKFKLKAIIDDLTQEEWTKIIGSPDELEKMEEAFVENLINTSIPKAVQQGKLVPESSSLTDEEYQTVKTAIQTLRARHGGERPAQFQKDIVANFEYYAKFYITNEAFDKQIVLQNLQAAIDTLAANPMLGLDATKLIEQKLDLMGINPLGLRKSQEQIMQEQQQAIQMAQAEADAAASGSAPVNKNPQAIEMEAKRFGQGNQLHA